MKRNPVYSQRAKSEQNGYKKITFMFSTGFGEIFQVEDAKLVK